MLQTLAVNMKEKEKLLEELHEQKSTLVAYLNGCHKQLDEDAQSVREEHLKMK